MKHKIQKINKLISSLVLFALLIGRVLPYQTIALAIESPGGPPAVPTSSAPQVVPTNSLVSSTNNPPTSAPSPNPSPSEPTKSPSPTVPAVTQPPAMPTEYTGPYPTTVPSGATGATGTSATLDPTGQPESNDGTLISPTVTGILPSDTENGTSSGSSGTSFESGSQSPNSQTEAGTLSTGSGTETNSSQSGDINDPYNNITGEFSINEAQELLDKKLETLNKNLAELDNIVKIISSTGFNYANYNTLVGQIFTGDSASSTNLLNKLNSNISGTGGFEVLNIYDTYIGDLVFKLADSNIVGSFQNASSTVAKNSATGAGSTNTGLVGNDFTVKEANGNDAKLTNDIEVVSTTGSNDASLNTGGGTVQTGDASALANIINLVNTNLNVSNWLFGVVNIFGTLAGNIIIPNDTGTGTSTTNTATAENTATGAGSTNTASIDQSEQSGFSNTNTADISSNVEVVANTGNNSSSGNTLGGSITTGNADTSVSNTTVANTNIVDEDGTVWLVIVNEMGKWVGHILGSPTGSTSASNALPITTTSGSGSQSFSTSSQNSGTGPLSDNTASFDQTSEETVTNTNTAAITNNITTVADTGNNNTDFNTGAGEITTGDAKAGVSLLNLANTNITAKKVVVLFVNVLGTLIGDIIPPEQTANQTSSGYISDVSNTAGIQDDTSAWNSLPFPTITPYQIPSDQNTQNTTASTAAEDTTNTTSTTNTSSNTSNTSNTGTDNSRVDYQNQSSGNEYSSLSNQEYGYWGIPAVSGVKAVPASGNETQYGNLTPTPGTGRGVYISPAFTKATESTFPAILLNGISLKVNTGWLAVVPMAIIVITLRRRRTIDLSKYLNSFLEILL